VRNIAKVQPDWVTWYPDYLYVLLENGIEKTVGYWHTGHVSRYEPYFAARAAKFTNQAANAPANNCQVYR